MLPSIRQLGTGSQLSSSVSKLFIAIGSELHGFGADSAFAISSICAFTVNARVEFASTRSPLSSLISLGSEQSINSAIDAAAVVAVVVVVVIIVSTAAVAASLAAFSIAILLSADDVSKSAPIVVFKSVAHFLLLLLTNTILLRNIFVVNCSYFIEVCQRR